MAQFTTQVATSIEQSQQLIELGVKPETADLVYRCTKSSTDSLEWELQLCPPSLENIDNNDIPAWSLVRLLELLPYEIPCDRPNVLHHPELIKYELFSLIRNYLMRLTTYRLWEVCNMTMPLTIIAVPKQWTWKRQSNRLTVKDKST